MALVVDTLDYSPLYNAIELRRYAELSGVQDEMLDLQGQKIALQKRANQLSNISDFAKIALKAVDVVTGIVSEVQFSKAKIDVQKDDLEIQRLARDAVLNDEVKIEEVAGTPLPSGAGTLPPTVKQTISMPKSLEDYFERRGQEIDQKYAGFPKVKAWARDQLYSSYDIAQKQVMSDVYTKAIRDKATLEGQLIEGALARSVQTGNYAFVDSAISASSSLTPAGKEVLRIQSHERVDFGQYDKAVRAAASVQGYDVGAELIKEWETKGKVTPEQARALETVALNSVKIAGATWEQKAVTQLQSDIAGGKDPEKSAQAITDATPEAYRSDINRLLDATVVQIKKEVNDKADAEMKDFYAKNPNNVVGLNLKLRNPEAKYSDRMDTNTWMFWEALASRSLKAGKEKTETPEPLKADLRSVIMDNIQFPTSDAKTEEVRRIIRENPLVTADTAREYISMAEDKVWMDTAVNDSLANIDAFFKVRESQATKDDKTGAKLREVQIQRDGVIREFTRRLKSPPSRDGYKDADIRAMANGLLSGNKSEVFKADQVSIYRANMPIDRRVLDATGDAVGRVGKIPLNIDEANQIEQAHRDMLVREYGIKPEQIADATRLANDLTQFSVGGLDPERPNAYYRLTFRTNPDTMNEELMVWEKTLNASGEEIGGNWIPAAGLPTVREVEEKRKKDQTAAAARAAENRRLELKRQQRLTTPTVEGIVSMAKDSKAGATVKELATIATAGAEEPSAVQVQAITLAFPDIAKDGKLTLADIKKIAKANGVSDVLVLRMAAERGWEVVE